jgi:hypothetical protein
MCIIVYIIINLLPKEKSLNGTNTGVPRLPVGIAYDEGVKERNCVGKEAAVCCKNDF